MKLDKTFSPTDVCAGLGLKSCSFRKLGDGPWAGTINTDVGRLEVEELATQWRITDEDGRVVSGTTLEIAIHRSAGFAR